MSNKKDEIEKINKLMHEDLINTAKKLQEFKDGFFQIHEKYEELKVQHEYLVRDQKNTITAKIKALANRIGGARGALLRLIFTPPVSKYLAFIAWGIVLLASFTGWPAIQSVLARFFKFLF
jgi:hypothetical protein